MVNIKKGFAEITEGTTEGNVKQKLFTLKRIAAAIIVVYCLTTLVSCNGRTVKEGGKAVKSLYKEYRALTETNAYRYYQSQRLTEKFNRLKLNLTRCSTCSGYGIVYMVDDYGNYYGQYDMCGNFYPNIYTCPACGGSGR